MNEDNNPPIEPPKKKGFLGKLQKRGTLSKRKRSTSLPPTEDEDSAAQDDGIRGRLEAEGAKRKTSKADMEKELKRVYAELDEARSQIQEKDKRIASLTKTNQSLKDQVRSSSDAVRNAKSLAREAQAAARTTNKEAEQSISRMARTIEQKDVELAGVKSHCREQIRLKDAATNNKLSKMKEEMETAIVAKVNSAVEKSEVSAYVMLFIF